MDQTTIAAIWCKDSETSEEVLIERATGKVLAKRWNGKLIDPSEWEKRNADVRNDR